MNKKVDQAQSTQKTQLVLIGWREQVSLPDFKIKSLKAKIDTGAKTSALHADQIDISTIKGKKIVKFVFTSEDGEQYVIKSPLIDERVIKSSNGERTLRPVVKTTLKMGETVFEIEVTLINRDMMGFKMLIGREALNGRFIIHPAKYNLLKPKKENVS
jgi:hypothetical protein